jgi:hypothetical protein
MTAELDSGPKPRPKPKGSAAYIALTSSVTPYNSTGSHDPTPTTESSTRPTGESADSTKSTPHGNPWIWSEEYRMHYRMEKDNTGKLRFTTGSIDLTGSQGRTKYVWHNGTEELEPAYITTDHPSIFLTSPVNQKAGEGPLIRGSYDPKKPPSDKRRVHYERLDSCKSKYTVHTIVD